ncbi:MAG: exodeoxyribonuclease V subunit gamma [Hydrogenophaga sp.]|uniref:exodeoxyribonuclease V subunit gamma n=1 Tax=Hydrogenophaga sp. TaxID=1904254 RepID=UPI00261C628F|nr:exodeoxyribonuclease V subunit gamma [Hydrogenophaga sp.]MDM7943565.1 exodeoxyribonuclease V subunit gamma [Hydrogenophaga sp.]
MTPLPAADPITPGFIVLHGNRSEVLMDTLVAWLGRHPLGPLEDEVVLVQSSGMAEWVKMELARQTGVCSSTQVELPGRFVWRAYRQVLGAESVPRESPLDKLPLAWRLMKVLPGLVTQPVFAPLAGYLGSFATDDGESQMSRLLQLTSQLSDLLDQYQNYRGDWLQAWSDGQDGITDPRGQTLVLAPDQLWQPALWRAVLDTLTPEQQGATRSKVHRSAVQRLGEQAPLLGSLPRRVVAFGMSHLPSSTMEMLAALAPHCQVILAVPNPCRFYWGDIMQGRDLFKAANRRQRPRDPNAASAAPFEDLHLHAHPLLAAWGRQGRDFVRQLDVFDDAVATAQAFPALKIDLFDEEVEHAETPLLTRVQQRIRDLEPLSVRHDDAPLAAGDRSIVFHVAHSAVRELEVLHDQLLDLLAQPGLQPRDIVVMVPDVQRVAAAIRAVFGQYPRNDKRHIPFDIADLSAKSSSPLITALQWLLQPSGRFGLSELIDLLEVPAVAQRFGIDEDKLPQLVQWMSGAGMRWGLHARQREQIGLAECGEQNTAWFGLQRMLLGYCAGALDGAAGGAGWDGIEPYTEVGGLDAGLAGGLAHLLRTLDRWWLVSRKSCTPRQWHEHANGLLDALFERVDEADGQALGALKDALSSWLRACDLAGFEAEADLAVLRHGWLGALQLPSLDQRFRSGGVTFCTLMPMRAIPFEVVCLLGMNDGDYPRRANRNDFDLMGQPGMFRPGDRARQHDDRQLMLEALLSSRRVLYVSWTGFSVRDNSEQPPSVLVAQLRDYVAAAWGEQAVADRTTVHPLQPFSRRYFEVDTALTTHSREWRTVHESVPQDATGAGSKTTVVPADTTVALDQERLVRFFRNPVKAFFRERLGVIYGNPEEEPGDTETFDMDGLENHQLLSQQIRQWPEPTQAEGLPEVISVSLFALQRSGALPMKVLGDIKRTELETTLTAMAHAWIALGHEFPSPSERISVQHEHPSVRVRDWVDAVYQNGAGERTWVMLEASKLLSGQGARVKLRPDKLLAAWVRSLLVAASGHSVQGRVVGQDGQLHIHPMERAAATQTLGTLLSVWLQGQQAPLPLPLKTSLALAQADAQETDALAQDKAQTAYEGGGDAMSDQLAEVRDMCLARVFPDFQALCEAETPAGQGVLALSRQVHGLLLKWAEDCVTVHPHASP